LVIKSMQILLEHNLITKEQLDLATQLKTELGGTIGYQLIVIGAIGNNELADFLEQTCSIPQWHRKQIQNIDKDVLSMVSVEFANELRVLPLALAEERLTLGITDPTKNEVIEEIAFNSGCVVEPVLVSEDNMTWGLQQYYGISAMTFGQEEPGLLDTPDPPPVAETPVVAPQTRSDNKRSFSAPPPQRKTSNVPPELYKRSVSDTPRVQMHTPIKVTKAESVAPEGPLIPNPVHGRKSDGQLGEGTLLAAIHKAPSRNAIIDYALQYLMLFSDRAAFFIVKKDKIEGFEIVGKQTSRTAIRSYWVPLKSSCTLSRVVQDKSIHLGPLGRSPADAILSAAMGGRPDRILSIPVVIGDRVVGILYAYRLKSNIPPWNSLKRLGDVAAVNLARVLVKKSPK
jgi:hypothetical protein